MHLYKPRDIKNAIDVIMRALRRPGIKETAKEDLREGFAEIWDDLQPFRDAQSYQTHVSRYISEEFRRKHDPREGEEKRQQPLCGCNSPTCPLKRGELLPAAKVNPGGVIDSRSPEQAIANAIQRHPRPFVLEEATQDWHRQTGEPLAELYELKAEARKLLHIQRGVYDYD